MKKIEIDVDDEMDALRITCRLASHVRGGERREYDDGYIYGVLAILGRDTQDLCGACEGCDNPFAPYKGMEE